MPTGIWLYSYVGLWLVLLVNSVILIALIRQVSDLHGYWVRNDPEWGLPLESLAPAIQLPDVFGRPVSLGAVRGEKTLLFFVSTSCGSCKRLMNAVPIFGRAEGVQLIVVVSATAMNTRLFVEQYRREELFPDLPVVADLHQEIMSQYKVAAVPYIVAVDQDGQIGAKGAALSSGEIALLLQQADQMRERRHGRASRLARTAPERNHSTEAGEPLEAVA